MIRRSYHFSDNDLVVSASENLYERVGDGLSVTDEPLVFNQLQMHILQSILRVDVITQRRFGERYRPYEKIKKFEVKIWTV